MRFRLLVLLFVGLVGIAYAWAAYRYHLFPFEADPSTSASLTENEMERLRALGYLPGYDEVGEEPVGVVQRAAEGVQPGLNLYLSAHAPEAFLMTVEGETIHSWGHTFEEACPDKDPEDVDNFFHRARVLPGGDLLAIFDYEALVRIDRESQLVWAQCRRYHHDFTFAGDGTIYAVSRGPRRVVHDGRPTRILDDRLEILSPQGEMLKGVSLYDAFAGSEYASMVTFSDDVPKKRDGDIFHVNAVKWLDGRHEQRFPAARRGNVLISIRHLSTIAIVDMERGGVVWARAGDWRFQHESVLLDSGNILLFDNYGMGEHSRVIELDPGTGETVWQYTGDGRENFFSLTLGSNERLANGNTLINLSARGRAIEVTPDHEVVWEFRSPHSVQDGELIATLQYLTRLRPDFPVDWLAAPD